MISYSAPAKVILSGEHAVVYGKPALVCAIDKRLNFSVKEVEKKKNNKDDVPISIIDQIVKKYLEKEKIDFRPKNFYYSIDSSIPIGRGLGSSAALSVAAAAALLKFYTGRDFDKETVNNLAYLAEKHFHKNPSGVDNTTSCFGGLIFYRKEFEFLKNISVLSFKIPKTIENNLFLIDSGKPKETTATMVELVKERYNQKPHLVEEMFEEIEKITKRITVALVKEDNHFFADNLFENQIRLELLGVVSKTAKQLLESLSQYGVGKITGAGGIKEGSGFILFYSFDNEKLIAYLEKNQINYFQFKGDFIGLKKNGN
jgi:mevalonate kinase